MGNADDAGRHLRLERETLRDLAPTTDEAAAIRGGDDNSMITQRCRPALEPADLLRATMMSYGCRGKINVEFTETGQEIIVDLVPNEAALELHEMLKQQAIAKQPDLSGRLDEIKNRPLG